jgi:O-antigen/teichoic acid export membrane protein
MGVFGLIFPGILIGEALSAAGFQRGNLVIQVASSGALIVLLLVLVPSGGAAGAAWALLLSYGLVVGATLLVARWRLQDGAPLVAMAIGALAAASGGAGLVLASGLGPLPSSLVGAAVALAVLIALRPSQVRGLWAAVTGSSLAR